MANLHVGNHVVRLTQSIVEMGLVELIWAIAVISVATLIFFV